jgi:hypothetical protein
MPAAFQIVSRASEQALTQSSDGFVIQTAQDDHDAHQMWVLSPQDSAADCLIVPLTSPEAAIGLDQSQTADVTKQAFLKLAPAQDAQVFRISRIANPPLFFLLEGSNDLLMDVPGDNIHGDGVVIQVFKRSEHANQQWTFLPVFAHLG